MRRLLVGRRFYSFDVVTYLVQHHLITKCNLLIAGVKFQNRPQNPDSLTQEKNTENFSLGILQRTTRSMFIYLMLKIIIPPTGEPELWSSNLVI